MTTYLVALHAMFGKFGLMASHAVEVLPFREEASSPDDLLAVAAGEAVFVPDGLLVLHVLVSCRGEAAGSPLTVPCRGLHPLGPPGRLRGANAGPAVVGLTLPNTLPVGASRHRPTGVVPAGFGQGRGPWR